MRSSLYALPSQREGFVPQPPRCDRHAIVRREKTQASSSFERNFSRRGLWQFRDLSMIEMSRLSNFKHSERPVESSTFSWHAFLGASISAGEQLAARAPKNLSACRAGSSFKRPGARGALRKCRGLAWRSGWLSSENGTRGTQGF